MYNDAERLRHAAWVTRNRERVNAYQRARHVPAARLTDNERFWTHVILAGPDDCWVWTAGAIRGYGHFRVGGRAGQTVKAHRFSFAAAYGPIPAGLHVLHRCDNPPCVNPAHLFLGTDADNVRDMTVKGRSWHQRRASSPATAQSGTPHVYAAAEAV